MNEVQKRQSIHITIDYWMRLDNFSNVDLMLESIQIASLNESLIVAILTASLPGKDRLINRNKFVSDARAHLSKTLSNEEVDEALDGLT